MRSLYESVDRKLRAQKHREDAVKCEHAGYPGFAQYNWEMAAFLDPYVPEEDSE